MAFTFTQHIAEADTTGGTSKTTASYTPTAKTTLVAFVFAARGGADPDITPTVSGNGITWMQRGLSKRSQNQVTAFVAWSGNAPSAGGLTADFGSQVMIGISIFVCQLPTALADELAFTQAGTADGVSGTDPAITLAALQATADNAVVYACMNEINPFAGTAEASWTEQWDTGHATPTTGVYVGYRLATSDNTIAVTQGSASRWCAVAVELNPNDPAGLGMGMLAG
jgi:hypothetical protein